MRSEDGVRSTVPRRLRGVLDRPVAAFVLLFALFGGILASWAIATPLGQTPDEWAHFLRADAVIHGQIMVSRPGPIDPLNGDPVRVSHWLADQSDAHACYRHRRKQSVACTRHVHHRGGTEEVGTTAARYPPFYYAAVGWPMAFGTNDTTLYLCRLCAVLLSAVFLAAAGVAALRLRTSFAMCGVLVALTPMVAYLGGMVNPNGLEITTATAMWSNLLLWLSGPDERSRRSGMWWAAISIAAMVLARSVAIVWALAAVVSLAVLVRRRWIDEQVASRRSVFAFLGCAVAGVVTVAWTKWSNALAIAPVRTHGFTPTDYGLTENMHRAFRLFGHWYRGAVANFGWLDTQIASYWYRLYALVIVVLCVLAVVQLALGRWRPLVALVLTIAAAGLLSAVMPALNANTLKITFWQGRYSLPLLVGIPIVAGYAAGTWRRVQRQLAVAVAVVLGVAVGLIQLAGFRRFFVRNSVGLLHPHDSAQLWQPPAGITLWQVLLVGGLVGLVVVVGAGAWTAGPINGLQRPSAGTVGEPEGPSKLSTA